MSSLQVKSYRKQLNRRRKSGEVIVCGICGLTINGFISIDHIIPLSAAGTHRKENLQPSHNKCNWSKADEMPPLHQHNKD